MSCGLVPVAGEIVTEQKALETLFHIKAVPIAAGGICGAEGAITWILEGEDASVRQAVQFVIREMKQAEALQQELPECHKGSTGCARHRNCAWSRSRGGELSWYEK